MFLNTRRCLLQAPVSPFSYTVALLYRTAVQVTDLEFSRLESWSRDVSRPVFTSLGIGLGLGTSESWSWSWSWRSKSWIQVCQVMKERRWEGRHVEVRNASSLRINVGTCSYSSSISKAGHHSYNDNSRPTLQSLQQHACILTAASVGHTASTSCSVDRRWRVNSDRRTSKVGRSFMYDVESPCATDNFFLWMTMFAFCSHLILVEKKLSYRRDSAGRRSLRRSRSFKVSDLGTHRKPAWDFLLVNNTNLHHISHRRQNIASTESAFL